jgi:hypothetical protein
MDKVDFIEIDSFGETITNAFITKDDGTWVSMLKSTYDEMIAQSETPTL